MRVRHPMLQAAALPPPVSRRLKGSRHDWIVQQQNAWWMLQLQGLTIAQGSVDGQQYSA